jgi:hypothetical protein
MKDGGSRFDLVAREGRGTMFVVTVRSTPEVKEAQDLAIQFVRQINANRQPGEWVQAFFVCDTPEDRGVRDALRNWPDIDLAWFNYTDLDTFLVIRQAIDRRAGASAPAASASGPTPDLAGQLEAAVNKRLDELDRQRTSELKDLYQRLAEAERRAAATETIPGGVDPETAAPASAGPATAIQFSAADLLGKPGLDFRLRAVMSSIGSWIELILLVFGLLVALLSSRLAALWVHRSPDESYNVYATAIETLSLTFLAGGLSVVAVTAMLLVRRYFAVESYFDYAKVLISEEYLAAPHPWLLAGANRITRQLALIFGPREGAVRLQKEIENLVGRRTAMPAREAPPPPNGATRPTPAEGPL